MFKIFNSLGAFASFFLFSLGILEQAQHWPHVTPVDITVDVILGFIGIIREKKNHLGKCLLTYFVVSDKNKIVNL